MDNLIHALSYIHAIGKGLCPRVVLASILDRVRFSGYIAMIARCAAAEADESVNNSPSMGLASCSDEEQTMLGNLCSLALQAVNTGYSEARFQSKGHVLPYIELMMLKTR